ncbi:unnamed protein product, partial [Ectocarpus sp. 12 AP-2014]
IRRTTSRASRNSRSAVAAAWTALSTRFARTASRASLRSLELSSTSVRAEFTADRASRTPLATSRNDTVPVVSVSSERSRARRAAAGLSRRLSSRRSRSLLARTRRFARTAALSTP